MDVCQHPELVPVHSVLADKKPLVGRLTPIFSLSKTYLHADILGIPTEQFVDNMSMVPWGERYGEKLLWRGSNTGGYYNVETNWRAGHRMRLVSLGETSKIEDGAAKMIVLPAPKLMKGQTLARSVEEVEWSRAYEKYMEVAFVGAPIRRCIVS